VLTEDTPLGTGGALASARAHLQEDFLLLNGDSFLDCNLLDLVVPPLADGSLVRMALKRGHPGERYGRARITGERLEHLLPPGTPGDGPINAGIYLMRRHLLDRIPPGPCALEAVLARLAEQGKIEGRCYDGYFIDIGLPAELAQAERELPCVLRRPAVFFDRDGVLNEDRGYVHRISDVHWVKGARAAVKHANDSGYLVFVVTNQAGVARGYYGIDAVERLHAWMDGRLAEGGAHVDAFQYCPFHEAGSVAQFRRPSDRRKPAPGMLTDCMREWHVDKGRSFLIGDKPSDIAAAEAAGIPGHLFSGGDLAAFASQLVRARAQFDTTVSGPS
jgi:D-glycero-D-manno-heptose 1,7-bisphosphate phosphatase